MNEADLRRHLDEAHRQMLDRDNAFRFHEREIETRDSQIEQLLDELSKLRAWASDLESTVRRLETTIKEMESSTGWRLEMRMRSLREVPRRGLRRRP